LVVIPISYHAVSHALTIRNAIEFEIGLYMVPGIFIVRPWGVREINFIGLPSFSITIFGTTSVTIAVTMTVAITVAAPYRSILCAIY
jgi:hypothetical protein